MNVVGLITEYNPFHNGHLLHLKMAKRTAQSELCIAVMSGNFVQRGEPALFNKWIRTEMALLAGVDLVIELPTAYATRNAQSFAWGAIGLLNATGVVTHLCFGSESGNLSELQRLAHFLDNETPEYQQLIKKYLSSGHILPKARSLALAEWLKDDVEQKREHWPTLMASPNNVLGIEYLTALEKWNSPIQPLTITRLYTGYHDTGLDQVNQIASATAIREHLIHKAALEDLKHVLPDSSYRVITREIATGSGPIFADDLSGIVLAKLRTTDLEQISQVTDLTEGLENRIKTAAHQAEDWKDLVSQIKSKRYTWSRIQRLLCHFLMGYNQQEAKALDDAGGPRYIRILGFNSRGQQLLQNMKKKATLPIITHIAPLFKRNFSPLCTLGQKMLNFDVLATDLHCLLSPNKQFRKGGLDYRIPPIIIK